MPKVLIVEDDLITATSIKKKLESIGYNVLSLEKDGKNAVLRANELKPDIVLMDIRLQGDKDGVDTALEIHDFSDIPVIFMTAYSDPSTLERAKEATPAGYILKPIDENMLMITIQLALYNHEIAKKHRESEERNRIISEITSDYTYSIRVLGEGRFESEWISGAFTEITGYTPDVFADYDGLKKLFHPDYEQRLGLRMKRLLAGREDVAEFKIITKKGTIRWLRDYARPVFDPGGKNVERIIGAATDITGEKEYEELLIAQRELAIGLTQAENLENALSLALSTAVRLSGMNRGGVYLRDRKNEGFFLAYHQGLSKKFVSRIKEIPEGSSWYTYYTLGTPKYVQGGSISSFPLDDVREAGLSSFAIIPVSYKGEVIGAVTLASQEDVSLSDQTKYMLETVTGLLSVFIIRFETSKALEESEARHRIISGLISDYAYSTDVQENGEMKIEWISGAVKKITGYTPEELKEFNSGWFDIVHPEDVGVFYREEDPADLSNPKILRYRIITKEGEVRWLEDYYHSIWDQYQKRVIIRLGAVRDITEKKRTEIELERQAERAEGYFDFAGVILVVLDNEGRVAKINHRGEALTGYRKEELLGKNWFDTFIPEDERENIRGAFRKYLDGGSLSDREYFLPVSQNPIVTKNGSVRIISWKNEQIRGVEGEILGTISSGEDITERLEAEEREKIQKQRLIQADKLASLGVLVAGVAHEINNPNQAILMTAQLLFELWEDIQPILDRNFSEKGDFLLAGEKYSDLRTSIHQYLRGIEQSSRRIDNIVSDLKKYSRNEQENNFSFIDLNDVVDSALGLMRNMIEESTRRFEKNLEQDLPRVYGNFQRLEQVVVNLLQNGCQALDDTGGGLTVRTYFDSVRKRIVLEVEDEGEGIPDDNLNKVADPFFTTKRSLGGTGLGMSVSSTIISDHGGVLEYESRLNEGTTARVLFPADGEKGETP